MIIFIIIITYLFHLGGLKFLLLFRFSTPCIKVSAGIFLY